MDILITALLFVSFYLIRVVRLKRAVQLITIQSALMAVVCIVRTAPYSSWEHTLIAGGLTILVKVILIPGGIFRILRGLPPDNPLLGKRLIYGSLLCVAALALSYSLTGNILPNVEEKQMISASLFLILSGLIIIVMRSHAVMQIVGLLTMENGIYAGNEYYGWVAAYCRVGCVFGCFDCGCCVGVINTKNENVA